MLLLEKLPYFRSGERNKESGVRHIRQGHNWGRR